MWCATRDPIPGLAWKNSSIRSLVAGHDNDQVLTLGLHHLQQDLHRLLAVVTFVLLAVQVVGLVDEQHAAVAPA